MPLSRLDAICAALKIDFADLAHSVADARPLRVELTLAQEKAVMVGKKLLLAMRSWDFEGFEAFRR
jgi:hypothetical protein